MKPERNVETNIGTLNIPRRATVETKKCPDQGSNLLEAYRPDGSFIRQKFSGYESQNRKPFTKKEAEDFISGVFEDNVKEFLVLLIGEEIQ